MIQRQVIYGLMLGCVWATVIADSAPAQQITQQVAQQITQQSPARFPFVIPGDDSSPTVTSRRSLLPAEAGDQGFVQLRDGHFFEGDDRIRFWGMNLCFPANFPTHEDADLIAPHLAKSGINAVRFHHMDMQSAPSGIWKPVGADGRRELDPEMVDRLDYFLAKLHDNGIYADLNLHVSRTLSPEEGYPKLEGVPWWADFNKWVMYYDGDVQAEVKRYARELLTHRNPYRQDRRRVDDPGIALVEMLNENYFSQQGYALYRKLPERFQASLIVAWNDWLAKKYGDQKNLVKSWSSQQPPMGDWVIADHDFASDLGQWITSSDDGSVKLPRRLGVDGPNAMKSGAMKSGAMKSGAMKSGATNAVRFEPVAAMEQTHKLQLGRDKLSVTANQPMTLTYWVRADQARTYTTELSSSAGGEWRDLGIFETLTATPAWQQVTRIIIPGETIVDDVAFRFSFANSAIPIEFAGASLRRGSHSDGLADDETLDQKSVPIPGEGAYVSAHIDMKQFMIDTEIAWVSELKSFLIDDLGVKVPITASQINYHTPEVNERLNDFIDLHNYWHHPMFPADASWDANRWTVGNDPMEADPTRSSWPANSLLMRSSWRYAGKPMTLSEWNYPEPSPYSAGCVSIAAVIAALQDWDAVFFFEYDSSSKTSDDWFRDQTVNFFSFNGQPVKMANFAIFANVFLRGDLAPIQNELQAPTGSPLPGTLGFSHRLSVSPGVDAVPSFSEPEPTSLVTPTGSVAWKSSPPEMGHLKLNTPATQGVWGTIAGQSFETDQLRLTIDAIEPNYGTVVITSVDGDAIATSKRMVLLASTSTENQAMGWNADRTSVGDTWGNGPTTILGIKAFVRIPDADGAIRVFSLDGTGKRMLPIKVEHVDGTAKFTISADDKTLWYEVTR
ncbi:hypothetical protein Poly51_12170 [Rubripirellula tenax]|uniref:Glycoside hydrolase family 5 domain-containing protein n=1 Tax=Rubripirellula tenax TaxID=2528015 RepID=A0A5C6FFM9_9BACT|nr:hypothetical protein [Rubripirellula tenax]TWU58439.1 hypothetical protein Poly51_12170 [Rubripirellula tenax]